MTTPYGRQAARVHQTSWDRQVAVYEYWRGVTNERGGIPAADEPLYFRGKPLDPTQAAEAERARITLRSSYDRDMANYQKAIGRVKQAEAVASQLPTGLAQGERKRVLDLARALAGDGYHV